MDLLNSASKNIPKCNSFDKVTTEQMEIDKQYEIVQVKQCTTKFGQCTTVVIKIHDAQKILFLPKRLNQFFTPEVLLSFNDQSSKKFIKYIGTQSCFEGSKQSKLFEFGDF